MLNAILGLGKKHGMQRTTCGQTKAMSAEVWLKLQAVQKGAGRHSKHVGCPEAAGWSTRPCMILAGVSSWRLKSSSTAPTGVSAEMHIHLLLEANKADKFSKGPAWEGSAEGPAAHALQGPHQLCMCNFGVRMLTSEARPQFLPCLPLLLHLGCTAIC